jgi:hypothetical protein
MAAAGLIIVTQVVGVLTASQSASDLAQALNNLVALVSLLVLLLALVGLYMHLSDDMGSLGLIGFVVAFVGTALVAGDWWFEAFVGPVLSEVAPQVFERPPSGWLLAGGVATFVLFAIGWVLFGIATLRTTVFPRPAPLLLIVGGAVGLLAGTPPFQVLLGLAVGWVGFWLYRSDRSARP